MATICAPFYGRTIDYQVCGRIHTSFLGVRQVLAYIANDHLTSIFVQNKMYRHTRVRIA